MQNSNITPFPCISLEMHEESENKVLFTEKEKACIRRQKDFFLNFIKTVYGDDLDMEILEKILNV